MRLLLYAFFACLVLPFASCGKNGNGDSTMGPTGKTGNQLTENDFADSQAPLALRGGPEFVEFCKEKKTCELQGEIVEKLTAVVKQYPASDPRDVDHFAVVVRQRLIEAGLVPKDDPNRYQYQLAQLATI